MPAITPIILQVITVILTVIASFTVNDYLDTKIVDPIIQHSKYEDTEAQDIERNNQHDIQSSVLNNETTPLKVGDQMYTITTKGINSFCTVGAFAYRDGKYYALTNGTCLKNSRDNYVFAYRTQGKNKVIGKIAMTKTNKEDIDFGMIEIDVNTAKILPTYDNAPFNVANNIGNNICIIGGGTDEHCNKIKEDTIENSSWAGLKKADVYCNMYDIGSYIYATNGSNNIPVGIAATQVYPLKREDWNSLKKFQCAYTPIENIEEDAGVKILQAREVRIRPAYEYFRNTSPYKTL